MRVSVRYDKHILDQSLTFIFDEIKGECTLFGEIDDLCIFVSLLLLLIWMLREEVFELWLWNGHSIIIIFIGPLKKAVLLGIELSNPWIIIIDVSEWKFALIASKQLIIVFDEEMLEVDFAQTLSSIEFQVCQIALFIAHYQQLGCRNPALPLFRLSMGWLVGLGKGCFGEMDVFYCQFLAFDLQHLLSTSA